MVIKYCILWSILSWGCFAGSNDDNTSSSGCFDVLKTESLFNTYNESLRLELNKEGLKENSEWLVIMYRPSDLVSYRLPHDPFLKDGSWVWSCDFENNKLEPLFECMNRTIRSRHFKIDNRAVFAKLDKEHPFAEMPLEESGMYCYDAANENVDDSTVTDSFTHPHSWLASRDHIDLYEHLLLSFISWLMIYRLISKWNQNKSNLQMSFRIKQMIYWFYIPSFVLEPLFARVIPTICVGIWDDTALFSNENVQICFTLMFEIVVILSATMEKVYLLLVSYGFDVLPRDSFPLFSKHYRTAWIIIGSTLTLDLISIWGFSSVEVLNKIFLFPRLFFILNRYTNTKKLLSTMSMSYPRRFKAIFEFYIWFFVSLLIMFLFQIVYLMVFKEAIDMSTYSGWRYVFNQLFDGLFNPIFTATYLNKYWSPELIESESTGSIKVDLQTVDFELETIKRD